MGITCSTDKKEIKEVPIFHHEIITKLEEKVKIINNEKKITIKNYGDMKATKDFPPIKGYEYLARIDRIIDGDTFELTILIPFSNMNVMLDENKDGGILCSIIGRLDGVDVAEKDTKKGKKIIRILEEKIRGWCGYAYCKFSKGKDKFGRYLCVLYKDETKMDSINRFVLEYRHKGRIYALPYTGGTKKDIETATEETMKEMLHKHSRMLENREI